MADKVQLDPKEVFLAITDPNTFATVLHAILLTTYGDEIYDLDPVEIYTRLGEDFGADITTEGESRVQAILMATSTDLFGSDPEAFRAICSSLTDGDPGIEIVEPLTVPEILWALFEVELNRGESHFTSAVENLIDQTIAGEASNTEEDPSVHPMDYVKGYLEAQREALRQQLTKVGFRDAHLPRIHPSEAALR